MKSILRFFLYFVMFFQMVGCAALQPKITTYPLDPVTNREFYVAKKDFSGEGISEHRILLNFASQLEKSGKYNKQYKVPSEPAKYGEINRFDISGTKTKIDTSSQPAIELNFYKGRYTPTQQYFLKMTNSWYTANEETSLSYFKVNFYTKIAEEGDLYHITLTYPDKADEIILSFGSNIAPTLQLIQDVRTKFIQIKQPEFDGTYNLTGDVDSKYASDAIYANFARALKKDSSNTAKENDIEKWGYFKIPYRDQELSVKVSVAPYRSGSKTKYVVTVPYKITDKNSIDKEYVDGIPPKIKAIVES